MSITSAVPGTFAQGRKYLSHQEVPVPLTRDTLPIGWLDRGLALRQLLVIDRRVWRVPNDVFIEPVAFVEPERCKTTGAIHGG